MVKTVAQRIYSRKNRYPKWFKTQINQVEKFWRYVGKKKPEDWTEKEYQAYLGTISQGSKFNVSTAIRQYGEKLKKIQNLTLGLKPGARKIQVLKLPEFPDLYQKIAQSTVNLAKPEERDEVEFILQIKPRIGIRTGERSTGKGFWGTKVGGQWKNKYNEAASYVQVVGNHFIWEVFEKKDERWSINFYDGATKKRIIDFVKRRPSGEYLLTIAPDRMRMLFREGCLAQGIGQVKKDTDGNTVMERKYPQFPKVVGALRLHDLRKVYVSFLVRIGIRLEKAITLNVGWLDIATAAKHYLEFAELEEDLKEEKDKFAALFGEETDEEGSDDTKLPQARVINKKLKIFQPGEEIPESDDEEEEEES